MSTTDIAPTTALATTTPGVLAIPTNDPWSDVEDGYIGAQPPEIAPTLPLFGFNANMGGGFLDEATGQLIGEGETVRAVWLAWSESRAWWEQEFGKGDKAPTCRSSDMIVPDPASPAVQSPTCASCPHSKWTDESPACGVRVNVMLYLLDEQRITRTAFRGIALKYVQRYIGGFKARAGGKPPMAFITEISVTAEATDFGDKLVPQFRVAEAIDFAEAKPLIDMRDTFLEQWKSMLAKDLAEASQHEGGGPDVGPFDDGGNATPRGTVETTSSQAPPRLDDEEPF